MPASDFKVFAKSRFRGNLGQGDSQLFLVVGWGRAYVQDIDLDGRLLGVGSQGKPENESDSGEHEGIVTGKAESKVKRQE